MKINFAAYWIISRCTLSEWSKPGHRDKCECRTISGKLTSIGDSKWHFPIAQQTSISCASYISSYQNVFTVKMVLKWLHAVLLKSFQSVQTLPRELWAGEWQQGLPLVVLQQSVFGMGFYDHWGPCSEDQDDKHQERFDGKKAKAEQFFWLYTILPPGDFFFLLLQLLLLLLLLLLLGFLSRPPGELPYIFPHQSLSAHVFVAYSLFPCLPCLYSITTFIWSMFASFFEVDYCRHHPAETDHLTSENSLEINAWLLICLHIHLVVAIHAFSGRAAVWQCRGWSVDVQTLPQSLLETLSSQRCHSHLASWCWRSYLLCNNCLQRSSRGEICKRNGQFFRCLCALLSC